MRHYLLDGLYVCGETVTDLWESTTDLLEVTCVPCLRVLASIGAFSQASPARTTGDLPGDDGDPRTDGR
jgi:hypothetical protein